MVVQRSGRIVDIRTPFAAQPGLSRSARSTADRILAVVPPISAFVAAGFEHADVVRALDAR
jgi:hypothetical protein